jgi:hypothetical protein
MSLSNCKFEHLLPGDMIFSRNRGEVFLILAIVKAPNTITFAEWRVLTLLSKEGIERQEVLHGAVWKLNST